MQEQSSRVAMITGGCTASGKAVALELMQRGWSLFVQHGPSEDSAAQTVEALQQAAGQAELAVAAADLTDGPQREQLVEQVLERFERIDLLVNAPPAPAPGAGVDLLEMSEETFHAVFDAQVTGTLFLTQLVASEMVRLVEAGLIESPKIVTLNSLSAYTSSVDQAPLCLSRSALAMMTQLFADRLGEHGINVFEVRTGLIASRGEPTHAKYDALIAQGMTPIRRWGRPQDVSRAVAAIAEDLLDFSTGEVLNVDGGFHLRRL